MKTLLLVSIGAIVCASAAAPMLKSVRQDSQPRQGGDFAVAPTSEVREDTSVSAQASSATSTEVANPKPTSVEEIDRIAQVGGDGKEALDPKDAKDLPGIGDLLHPAVAGPYIPGALGFPPTFGAALRTIPRSN